MKSDLPKVLQVFNARPLILHVIDNLTAAGVHSIVVVVGYRGDMVADAVKGKASIVWQKEQLGTGHAVMQAEPAMKDYKGKVIVACGDVPMIRPATFQSLIDATGSSRNKAVVLTMEVDDPSGYGRIIKDDSGSFLSVVEEKDASPEIKKIREVNTGTYVFDSEYLFEGLKRITDNNAQREFYLPDALQHVLSSGYKVEIVKLENADEGRGVNTVEDLRLLEKLYPAGYQHE